MGRSEDYNRFPEGLRKDVKYDQGWRCGYCGMLCRGHGYAEPRLEVHHIVPDFAGGPNTRENAMGLCGHELGCHCYFDNLYREKGRTVVDVMMSEGRQYDLSKLGLAIRRKK